MLTRLDLRGVAPGELAGRLPRPNAAGEAPVAAVQLVDGATVTETELVDLVRKSLATYKQLRHLVVVDAIPRLPSGKVLRRTLRDEWAPKLENL